jgi:predicted SprT family Zn-dependent metalloprotease
VIWFRFWAIFFSFSLGSVSHQIDYQVILESVATVGVNAMSQYWLSSQTRERCHCWCKCNVTILIIKSN